METKLFEVRARTMHFAHKFIEDNFDCLPNEAVVDVEFALGETSEPKVSQRSPAHDRE